MLRGFIFTLIFFYLSLTQTGVVVQAYTWVVFLDLSRPEILDNLHVQRIRLYTREEFERPVRTYFWLNNYYLLWPFLVLHKASHSCVWLDLLSLFQDNTLHFAVQVAEDSPSASGNTGAEERCTLPQVFVTPQTKLLKSQESRILANPDCLCCDQ